MPSQLFKHMCETTVDPKFRILEAQPNEPVARVAWTFSVGVFGKVVDVDGTTRFGFAEDGRVLHHRDYWDARESGAATTFRETGQSLHNYGLEAEPVQDPLCCPGHSRAPPVVSLTRLG